MYKRREFLVKKYQFRNIGLPMIVSGWNKTDRFNTSMVYGYMAFSVFAIIYPGLSNTSEILKNANITDITGLLKLLIKTVEVIILGFSKLLFCY